MRTEFDNRIKLGLFVVVLIYTVNDKNIYSEEVKIQISMFLVQVV